jgi:uncharacterized protein YbaR (Trm112 family)
MAAKPLSPAAFDASIVDQLACPACCGDLRVGNSVLDGSLPDRPGLICVACGRAYPIIEGIPVLTLDPISEHG